jgi:hypothetical protein
MNKKKMLGYTLYAVGIIGGVESTMRVLGSLNIPTAVIALAIIIIASYLIQE